MLRAWVVREGAAHTIEEIGLGYALSALHICEGLITNGTIDARHVVIDPFQSHRFTNVGLHLLVRRGGVIILDDYDMPAIRRAVAFFVANRGWAIESAAPEWVVLRTSAAPDERPFDSFVEF